MKTLTRFKVARLFAFRTLEIYLFFDGFLWYKIDKKLYENNFIYCYSSQKNDHINTADRMVDEIFLYGKSPKFLLLRYLTTY